MREYRINVEIKVPIMKQNEKEYKRIKEYCQKNGFRFNYTTSITAKTNGDRTPYTYSLSQMEMDRIIHDLEGRIKIPKPKMQDAVCSAVYNSIHIDVKGNVYPCISFPYIYGNIYEKSIREIWYHSEERNRLLTINKGHLKMCNQCDLQDFCIRCPGLAYSEDKTLLGCSILDRKIAIARTRYKSSS